MSEKKKMTPADYDRWETPPGTFFSIDAPEEEDEPEEKRVAKSYEEIRKFNPFHDARGRFSNKNGFSTYSANPKTKSGAMAIQRSFAGGHGRTMNVHRESKGESITQNANWLKTGKKPAVPAAVSRAKYQQRQAAKRQAAQMLQQGQTHQPAAPKAQQQTAPAAKPKQTQQNTSQNPNTQQANQHKMVQGKDISKIITMDTSDKRSAYDQIAGVQGYDKKGRVVDKKEFDAAVKASGFVGYRTWDAGRDGVTGKQTTADEFKKQFMDADSIQAAGNGLRAYGGGTYIAATKDPKPGTAPSRANASAARTESRHYGRSATRATASITLDPSAKVADYDSMRSRWQSLSRSDKKRFGNDIGAYAAAQGYDAMRKRFGFQNYDYVTIFNRTKTIILRD